MVKHNILPYGNTVQQLLFIISNSEYQMNVSQIRKIIF